MLTLFQQTVDSTGTSTSDSTGTIISDSTSVTENLAEILDTIPDNSWVFISVFALISIWIIASSIVFFKLLAKYPLGNWKKGENPYEKETFAMPRGVFRGLLTLSLLFTVMLLEVVNLLIEGLEDKIEQLLVLFQMIIAFYFGSKVMHHVTAADRDKKLGRSPETQTDS